MYIFYAVHHTHVHRTDKSIKSIFHFCKVSNFTKVIVATLGLNDQLASLISTY